MSVKRSGVAALLLLLPCVAWAKKSDEPSSPPEQDEGPPTAPPEEVPPASEPKASWTGASRRSLFPRNLELAVKGLGVGMGQPGARYLGAAEGRWPLLGGKLYALGTAGTRLFPKPKGRCAVVPSPPWAWGWTLRANALVLCVALLSSGCASVSLAPSRSGSLRHSMPRGASRPSLAQSPQEERPHTPEASPSSPAGDALQRRLVRRRAPQESVTGVAPGGGMNGTAASAAGVHDALLEAVRGVKDSTDNIASALSELARRPPTSLGNRGLSGTGGAFTRFLEHRTG